MRRVKYLRHTSRAKLAGMGFRALFTFACTIYGLLAIVRGLATGEIEVPLRASHFVVTTATPDWFALVMFIWLLMTGIFGVATFGMALQYLSARRA